MYPSTPSFPPWQGGMKGGFRYAISGNALKPWGTQARQRRGIDRTSVLSLPVGGGRSSRIQPLKSVADVLHAVLGTPDDERVMRFVYPYSDGRSIRRLLSLWRVAAVSRRSIRQNTLVDRNPAEYAPQFGDSGIGLSVLQFEAFHSRGLSVAPS